ncbi:alpha-hydroxy acid oxidase [Nonomuraea sp. NPDC050310]|uniref:alpha-hydroxy acid oxidase n=1 Tax=Nonomuraea sp. NPDC050310 TaxID=3154935 RepID=UPI00340F0BEC
MTMFLTLDDFERAAQLAVDRRWCGEPVWDFIAGGAGAERTLEENRAAFNAWRLEPRVAVDVSGADLGTIVLGDRWAVPIGMSPTALHQLCCDEGELASVTAAARVGVPLTLSTFASRTVEEVTAWRPDAQVWQQVYVFKDRKVTASLVERAQAAGARAIVVTVDSPWLGRRHRDLRRGGKVIPPQVVARNLAASVGHDPDIASPAEHSAQSMDPSLTWADITWLTTITDLPVVVKGVQHARDAEAAVAAGAGAVFVSNHGGRQLDQCRATLEVLPEVVAAVGEKCPVILDGGIRSGLDVLVALALGARAVMVGRPVLAGLAAGAAYPVLGGAANGVGYVMRALVEELLDAMGQTGRPTLADIGRDLVSPAPPYAAKTAGCGQPASLPIELTFPPELTLPAPSAATLGAAS